MLDGVFAYLIGRRRAEVDAGGFVVDGGDLLPVRIDTPLADLLGYLAIYQSVGDVMPARRAKVRLTNRVPESQSPRVMRPHQPTDFLYGRVITRNGRPGRPK